MALKNITTLQSKEDATKVLEQFQKQLFLAEIDEIPELSADGHITNLETFKKEKNKFIFQSGSSNPVHMVYAMAPKAVSVILEAMDEMDAEADVKQELFDVFISEKKKVDEADSEKLDQGLAAFMAAYKGHELEGPRGCR